MKSIAIDGPSGAGKSTLARKLASELGFLYVDTGAIYRTVALFAQRQGVNLSDADAVTELLADVDISMKYGEDGLQRMYLAGDDVTTAIRVNEVSQAASKVAAVPAVRAFLLDFQRKQAQQGDVIMDGRDIGTVVLPNADVKVYLTATSEARAKRRMTELQGRGQDIPFDEILQDIIQRDERDYNRPIAPLCQAEDAVVLDTTRLNREESFSALVDIAKEGLGR